MTTHKLNREICRNYIAQHLFKSQNTSKDATASIIGRVGVELEAFPYLCPLHNRKEISPVFLYGDRNSLMEPLIKVSGQHKGVVKYWQPHGQYPDHESQVESIEFPDGDRFFFEPGGQVEISTAPCTTIRDLECRIGHKQEILNSVSQHSDIHFAQLGTNPWWGVDVIPNQLQRPRYRTMEHYFDRIGPYGKRMMLQTCSLHINIDLGTSSDIRTKRIIAASLLAPFATALFANSSVSGGHANGHASYRSYVWQQLDANRTGILPLHRLANEFSEDKLIDLYLDLAINAPLIYIKELGEAVLPPQLTFGQWMARPVGNLSPSIPHLVDHLSLLFPEVRLKGYLEIRSVDAPPLQWQLVPVMFYTGLLYNEQHLDSTLELLLPLDANMQDLYVRSTFGLASDDIFNTSKKLMQMAIDGCSALPATFREEYHTQQLIRFFTHFTCHRKTFADEQLTLFKAGEHLQY